MVAAAAASSFLGVVVASVGLVGFYKDKLSLPERLIALGIAVSVCWPNYYLQILGVVVSVVTHFIKKKGGAVFHEN